MDTKLELFLKQIKLDEVYFEKFNNSTIVSIIYKKSLKKFIVNISIECEVW